MQMSSPVLVGIGVTTIAAQVVLLFANSYGHLVPENPFPYFIAMCATFVFGIIAIVAGGAENDRKE